MDNVNQFEVLNNDATHINKGKGVNELVMGAIGMGNISSGFQDGSMGNDVHTGNDIFSDGDAVHNAYMGKETNGEADDAIDHHNNEINGVTDDSVQSKRVGNEDLEGSESAGIQNDHSATTNTNEGDASYSGKKHVSKSSKRRAKRKKAAERINQCESLDDVNDEVNDVSLNSSLRHTRSSPGVIFDPILKWF